MKQEKAKNEKSRQEEAVIETERLRIVALSGQQMSDWVNHLAKVEEELGCTYRGESMENEFRFVLQKQAEKCQADAANCLWHTFWWIVRKEDDVVIGSIDFKNVPQNGSVEIGYGLEKTFEGSGYMTETVLAFCDWAFRHGVVVVTAETERTNLASQRVLLRCGFSLQREENTLWWQKEKPNELV